MSLREHRALAPPTPHRVRARYKSRVASCSATTRNRRLQHGSTTMAEGYWRWQPGPGKTKTALAAVARLIDRESDTPIVVVTVPYIHLVDQWSDRDPLVGFAPDSLLPSRPRHGSPKSGMRSTHWQWCQVESFAWWQQSRPRFLRPSVAFSMPWSRGPVSLLLTRCITLGPPISRGCLIRGLSGVWVCRQPPTLAG